MSNIPEWYGRKFDFAFPAELYPNLCVRLRGTPARLEEMLQALSREITTRKPENKWSAQEHVGHLVELEPLWLARVEDFAKSGDTLTVTDLSNRATDAANYNARELKGILAGFRRARMNLVNRIEAIEAAQFKHTMLHPRLKQPMRLVDHLFFVAEHDDHHMARIWEMIRA
jgi:uncharacterized damage-inducible protein DinB